MEVTLRRRETGRDGSHPYSHLAHDGEEGDGGDDDQHGKDEIWDGDGDGRSLASLHRTMSS